MGFLLVSFHSILANILTFFLLVSSHLFDWTKISAQISILKQTTTNGRLKLTGKNKPRSHMPLGTSLDSRQEEKRSSAGGDLELRDRFSSFSPDFSSLFHAFGSPKDEEDEDFEEDQENDDNDNDDDDDDDDALGRDGEDIEEETIDDGDDDDSHEEDEDDHDDSDLVKTSSLKTMMMTFRNKKRASLSPTAATTAQQQQQQRRSYTSAPSNLLPIGCVCALLCGVRLISMSLTSPQITPSFLLHSLNPAASPQVNGQCSEAA